MTDNPDSDFPRLNKAITGNRPMVELVKVTKVYPPDMIAVEDISFSVARGEMVYLTGMSGAGKTTLLKLICNLETADKGVIEIGGKDLSRLSSRQIQRLRQQIGMAYQDFKLLPDLTVYQNIAMAMEVTYRSVKTIRRRVADLLEALKLQDKSNTLTAKLSRGEQQRVAIARAASTFPQLLLADEPTGNLDPMLSGLVIDLFEQLNKAGTTLIIATHDEFMYRNNNHRVMEIKEHRLQELSGRQSSAARLEAK